MRYGDIIGMDFLPELRAMALCPAPPSKSIRGTKDEWQAVVLADTRGGSGMLGWVPGTIVTCREGMAGFTRYEYSAEVEAEIDLAAEGAYAAPVPTGSDTEASPS